MKIAVSGAHWTGKTTLVEELSRALPDHSLMIEPYYLLEEAGHIFPESPGLEDFELQLAYSIEQVANGAENIIFDRCPADILAYLSTHVDFEGFNTTTWFPKIQNAMVQLDLLVFVAIEDPDLIGCPESADPELRSRVDEELSDIILADTWGFNVDVLQVNGSPAERLQQVLAHEKLKL